MDRNTRDQLFRWMGETTSQIKGLRQDVLNNRIAITAGQEKAKEEVSQKFAKEVEPLAADMRSLKRAGAMAMGILFGLGYKVKEVQAFIKAILGTGH